MASQSPDSARALIWQKLLAGTKQRFSGFCCGEDVLRIFVTGGPPVLGVGARPAHQPRLLGVAGIADHWRRTVRKDAAHRRHHVALEDQYIREHWD